MKKVKVILVFFLQRSRHRWSHTGDEFCLQGHRRAAQWRASLETWLSWGQSVQWRAMWQRCSPSRVNWPGTLHCDSPGDSTRHPGDMRRKLMKTIWNRSAWKGNTLFLCCRARPRDAGEDCHTLNCCCVTAPFSGLRNSRTWGIRSLQQKL